MDARLLLVMLAGCAGAEAMSLPTAPASPALTIGFYPGESMTYDVQLQGVLVGEAELAVGEPGVKDGRREIVVKSRAATAGAAALVKTIVDESTTTLDLDTGRPIQVDTLVVSGDKTTTASAKFAGSIANVIYKLPDRPPLAIKIDTRTPGIELHDMHSAMAAMRGWRATPGTVKTVFLVGGRRLWKIDVKYVGEETIGSRLGNRHAVVYEGTSYRARRDLKVESTTPARTFRVWMSDDADRVPLKCSAKTELGDIIMELTAYNRP